MSLPLWPSWPVPEPPIVDMWGWRYTTMALPCEGRTILAPCLAWPNGKGAFLFTHRLPLVAGVVHCN